MMMMISSWGLEVGGDPIQSSSAFGKMCFVRFFDLGKNSEMRMSCTPACFVFLPSPVIT